MKTEINGYPMTGKLCLVTGATAGIGAVIAKVLAAQGAEVIVTGRNRPKAEKIVQDVKSSTGNESVRCLIADFSDLQQVRDMAAEFNESYQRLDVLINNAGAFFNTRIEFPGGVEKTFVVNHLSPFLLTNLLMGALQANSHGRIINVSSDAHKQDKMNFDDLSFKRGYVGIRAYARSKLANILFTYELARRHEGTGMMINALHPGHVATDIWKTNFSLIGPALKWLMSLIALTPEQGADNSIYLATSSDVEGVTGKYFVKRDPVKSSPASYDEKTAQKLWELSTKLTI